MFHITAIRSNDPAPRGDGASYLIEVSVSGTTRLFAATVKPGPNGPQLDWEDDFQDLMMAHDSNFPQVNLLLFQVHCGENVVFPVEVGNVA